MSVISEQVADLREKAQIFEDSGCATNGIVKTFREAADTIENLSAKLADVNMERSTAYYNDGWIPCSERLPDTEEEVWVILGYTYKSDCTQKSIARYIRFENGEAHWCDNKWGYLEWEKYSDGHGGCSSYKVLAWMPAEPYKGVE